MSIQERKNREAKELKAKIIRAVQKLFARGGYDGLSMRRIAREIDYSPTTIYRFFKNKEEILCTITRDTYRDLSEKFRAVAGDPNRTDLQKLKDLVSIYTRWGLENPDIYRLYISLARIEVRDKGIHETIGGKTYRIFGTWQALIERLSASGKIHSADPLSTVVLLWNTAEGLILNRYHNPALPWLSDREEIERMIDMIFQGIQR